jgi:hypothetical protein
MADKPLQVIVVGNFAMQCPVCRYVRRAFVSSFFISDSVSHHCSQNTKQSKTKSNESQQIPFRRINIILPVKRIIFMQKNNQKTKKQ